VVPEDARLDSPGTTNPNTQTTHYPFFQEVVLNVEGGGSWSSKGVVAAKEIGGIDIGGQGVGRIILSCKEEGWVG
jgi:hypothetical protein